MAKTVAETIKTLSKKLVDKNKAIIIGQCLSAVGWVQNTVPPQKKGIIELPMTDVAGAGFAVGASLEKKMRAIFILRFQSFLWLNASPLINHAAKAKEIFGYSAPVLIRAIASEGPSSGPLHTNCYHSPFAHMPGLPICAPMSPNEYKSIWKHYLKNDDPLLVSEHRRSYKENIEFKNYTNKKSKISIFAISACRFDMEEVKKIFQSKKIEIDIFHIIWLKPFKIKTEYIKSLNKTNLGIVIDSSYEICSVAEHISYKLMHASKKAKIHTFGMKDKSPGCSPALLNGTPSTKQIVSKILKLI